MQHLAPHAVPGSRRLGKWIFALLSMLAFSMGMALPAAQAQSYSEAASLSSPGANPSLAWGDHNQDGNLDLAVVGKGNSAIYTGDGSGGFSSTFSFINLDNGAADWGDFDRDGDLDLVVTGFEPGQGPVTAIYENTGGGNFSVVGAGIVGLSDGSPSWGDYDNDGDLDLLVSGIDDSGTNITRVYRNDGSGSFVQALDGGQQGGPSAWGDFDGDGDLDFVVTGHYSPLTIVWRNRGDTDGDGSVEFSRVSSGIPGVQNGDVAWGDADADGAVELALSGNDGTLPMHRVYDYANGSFVEETTVGGVERGSVDWGDADNDGDLDLLVTGFNGEAKLTFVYTNDGDGTSFSFAADSFPALSDGRAAFGDYDDDGVLDAAITGNDETGSNILKVFSGSAGRTNRPPQPPSLATTLEGLNRSLTLEWGGATDRAPTGGGQPTPTSALTYNIFLRSQGSANFLRTPLANPTSGQRWAVQRGNMGGRGSIAIDPSTLSEGTYEWSAQAIDYNYAGSSFPTAGTFTISRTDLGLSADVADPTISQGSETTVTLTLSNEGSSASAGGSEVSVTLPGGLSVTGSSGDGSYDFASNTWVTSSPIMSGGSATLDLTVRLDEEQLQPFLAELTATETLDDNVSNHTAQTTVTTPPYGSGQALSFDGSGDYVATGAGGDDLGLTGESFSVDVWFKPNSFSGRGDDHTLVGQDAGSKNEALHLTIVPAGTLDPGAYVRFGFFGNDLYTRPSNPIKPDEWQHLTFVYDAAKADGQDDRFIYLNGDLLDADESSSDFEGTSDLRIGRWGGGNYFDGQIDQVRVWQSALTRQEVQARMNRTIDLSSAVADDVVAAYRFDAGSGPTAYDLADGHNGTLEGDPQWTDPSGASVGQTSALVTDANTPQTLGPSGSRIEADLTNSAGRTFRDNLTIYRWGAEGGALITGENLPTEVDDRTNVTWGVWSRGYQTEADLTISYGDVSGLDAGKSVRLLQRDRPGAAWTYAADASHDPEADQFTVTGVTDPAQYAVANIRMVDLQLVASAAAPERGQGEQTTVTLTLDNTDPDDDATGVAVDVSLPSGLSVVGSSGDGSYSGGSWSVGTVGANGTATLDLTVQKDAASFQTLTAEVSALDQGDSDGASTSATIAPPPYGSGQALSVDGDGDYVNAGDGFDLADRSFSVSFWAKRASSGGDDYIVSQGTESGTNVALHVGFRAGDEFTFAFFGNDLNVSSTYTDTNWHHWAATYDADSGDRVIYRDGVEVARETGVDAFQGSGPLRIGTAPFGERSDDFDGQIDQVRIWHAALTQQQIQARMNRTIDLSSSTAEDLVAAYRFDAGTGRTAYDVAGGRNGTLEGDPQWIDPGIASAGQSSAVVTDASTPGTLGPSGSRIEADLTDGTGLSEDLTIYRWGAEGGTFITDETVPAVVTSGRSNVAWGAWPRGSATSDLTISYGDVSGLDASEIVRLLRRDRPGQAWTVAAGASHDPEADQFTVTGVTDPAQYAVANTVTVDLQLTAHATEPEREQGEQTTVTLTLDNTDAATEATGVAVDVSVPDDLSLQGSNTGGDGSYSGGTWSVGTVGAGATATLDLTVQKDAASFQTLTAQVGALDQGVLDTAHTSATLAPPPYGSEQALAFDGSDDHVNAGDDIRLDNRSFSISFWAKRASSGNNHYVVGQGPNDGTRQSLHVGFRNDGRFAFAFYGDDLITDDDTGTDEDWHHWAVTFDASTKARRIYRDGLQVASDNAGGAFEGTGDFFIGQRAFGGGGNFFDGRVDQVRVWHAALTQQQIQARMNRTIDLSSSIADDLVAAYRFDAGAGQTAYDVAGAFDGTLDGGPQRVDPSGASVGRESAVLVDGATPVTVGPSGSSVEATQPDDNDPETDATVYRWGAEDGPKVADGTLSDGRSNVVWGLRSGGAAADLTISYGDVQNGSGSQTVYLLRRARPGTPWFDMSGRDNVSHDAEAGVFSVTGTSNRAQYAVSNEQPPNVDLGLTAAPAEVQIQKDESFTTTLVLKNHSNLDATGAEVSIDVPSGLTLSGSSGDGTLNGATWSVPSLGIGATASMQLTLTNNTQTSSVLSAEVAGVDQAEVNASNDAVAVSVLAYGSGSAIAFDGDGDYIDVHNTTYGTATAIEGDEHFTIEAWVYVEDPITFNRQMIADDLADAYAEDSDRTLMEGYALSVQDNGSLSFKVAEYIDYQPNSTVVQVSGGSIPARTWTHVAAVYNHDTNISLYVNGRQVDETPAGGGNAQILETSGDNNKMTFGAGESGNLEFEGEMDQVRIWTASLSQEQIQARAHRLISLFSATADHLAAAYRFDTDGSTVRDVTGGFDGKKRGSPQRVDPSGASVGRESAVLTDATAPVTVGPSGSRLEASLTNGTGLSDDVTVYHWGTADSPAIMGEDFSEDRFVARSNAAWGAWPRGSAAADLTISYGDVSSLVAGKAVRLLQRDHTSAAWTDVTESSGVTHDSGAQTFTVTGVSEPAQYAVANFKKRVDLTLASSPQSLQIAQGNSANVTLTLKNTDAAVDATSVSIGVAVPDKLTVQSSSVSAGSYTDGAWTLPTLAAGATATLDLTVRLDAIASQAITAQLDALYQRDSDGARTSAMIAPLPYGSGQALAFDGSGDYVSTGAGGDDLGLTGESFSVGAWVRVDDLSTSRTVMGMDTRATNEGLHLVVQSDGSVKFGFYGNDLTTSADAVPTGTWTHLTFVYDAADEERYIYRNGLPVASETGVSSDFQGTDEVLIGRWSSGNYFDGRIDQVRVWQGALTQPQVQARAHHTLDLSSTAADDLVAAYRFDAGSGTTAYDVAGGNNGTFQGDPQWADPSGALAGQSSTVLADGTSGTLGPTGGTVDVANVSASGSDALAIYQYGRTDGPSFTQSQTGEDFSQITDDVTKRLHVVWGLEPAGSASADVTFDYSGLSGLTTPANVRLLKRDRPGAPWQNVSDSWTWDDEAKTFSKSGLSTFSQYAIGEASSPLPVELAMFEAAATGEKAIQVRWQTAGETGNAGFQVQRQEIGTAAEGGNRSAVETDRRSVSSGDGDWQTLGSVDGAGTTDEPQSYRFTDEDLPYAADSLTYRLKQVDTDGSMVYTEALTVARSGVDAVQLLGTYPNPARRHATVRFAIPEATAGEGTDPPVEMHLYDVLGRRVHTVRQEAEAGRHKFRLDTSRLSSGVYFLRLQAQGTIRTQKLTVVK